MSYQFCVPAARCVHAFMQILENFSATTTDWSFLCKKTFSGIVDGFNPALDILDVSAHSHSRLE